jgi:23S rRNA (cytidine1920-2'-O)/16S rRNA (cytidine1409-2'-O)-methyltransferase
VTGHRKRLDQLLVERGDAPSIAIAQAMIMAGEVRLGGLLTGRAPTAGMQLDSDTEIIAKSRPRFVSRAGEKLDAAIEQFGLSVSGLIALDVGASTGGFTDCVLQRGATRVHAVDVGHGQIDSKISADSRVLVQERVNARHGIALPEQVDLIVMDVSFISVTNVIPAVLPNLREGGQMVVLLKPQFEAKRGEVGKGGVILDMQLRARIVGRFAMWATENGLRVRNLARSSVVGSSGNEEFLIHLEPVQTL